VHELAVQLHDLLGMIEPTPGDIGTLPIPTPLELKQVTLGTDRRSCSEPLQQLGHRRSSLWLEISASRRPSLIFRKSSKYRPRSLCNARESKKSRAGHSLDRTSVQLSRGLIGGHALGRHVLFSILILILILALGAGLRA
jgi:hypothetical protein